MNNLFIRNQCLEGMNPAFLDMIAADWDGRCFTDHVGMYCGF